ncbi:TPA: DUF5431 family protein [Citrobacter freundii]|nr:DUF5431 family protein [Citrobacter freundii]HBC8731526.1 DUF5431 family protein [Citrobacter braakii]HCA7358286.1 DUF5431 family protein [Citrobacter freundii]
MRLFASGCSGGLYLCREAERQKPQLIFINRGPCMNRHHQDSLLDAVRQGEEGHC